MTLMRPLICALCLGLPLSALAHPHIFVETGLRVVTDDQGRAIAVEVSWTYDDLYSLLMLEDMELDGDYDGKLTPDELGRLHGFDMQWIDGFEGDLYVAGTEGAVTLGAPLPLDTRFDSGKITTRHRRDLSAPQATLVVKAYDPTFYTAYDLTGGITAPEGCQIQRTSADTDAAYAKVEQMMIQRDYAQDDYPAVGEAFADTVTVTCAAK